MKPVKRCYLLFFCLLFSTACGTTNLVSPTLAPTSQLVAATPTLIPTNEPIATLAETSTPEAASTGTDLNPPPETVPAPNTSPQPAAPPRHHPGDAVSLDQIHMVSDSNGWGTSGAEVLVTTNGAQTWKEVTPPEALPSDSQIQIQGAFLDQSTAWVVFSINNQIAPEAVVWHTTDGGHTWTPSAPLNHQAYGDQVWAEFSALDVTHVWLIMRGVYAGAGIHYAAQFFRTTDGGLTWLPLIGDVGVDYTGLVFADADHGLLTWQTTGAYASAPPEYAVTSDGAVNWEVRELPPPPDAPDLFDTSPYCEPFQPHILPDHTTRLLVGCFDEYDPPHVFNSYIYASSDNGATWTSTRLPDSIQAAKTSLIYLDQNNAFLLGRDIYHTYDGQTWLYVRTVYWDGQFTFVNQTTGWAIARADNQTALVKTTNSGDSWIEIKPVIAP